MTARTAGPAPGAVVLAAGYARRMGGRPKALIERDGVPLVRRMVLALRAAGVDPVVVVLGHCAAAVRAVLDDLPVQCVLNEAHASGRVSSARAGLAALPPGAAPVMVALADQPLLEAGDVTALLDAFAARGAARALVPRVGGVRGNPVVFDAGVREEILAGGDGCGPRQWLDRHPSLLAWFDSDNVHYVVDVDEPADLQRIAQRHGCAMRLVEPP